MARDEQTAARRLAAGRRPDLGEAIRAAERLLGRPWETMLKAYGDWGRDGVLYVTVRHCGYRIRELEGVLPGVRYAAAAQGIQRFARELGDDADRAQFVDRLRREVDQMSNGCMRPFGAMSRNAQPVAIRSGRGRKSTVADSAAIYSG